MVWIALVYCIVGTVISKGIIPTRKGLRIFQAVLRDETGMMEVSWPGQPFLDRSINKVLHLSDSRLHEFKGTYSSYLTQLEADLSQRERSAQLEGREIKRLSTLADSMRGSTNRRARIAKSIDKRVSRLQAAAVSGPARERKYRVRFPQPPHTGRVVLEGSGLAKAYGGSVTLGESTLGGLKVEIFLPQAER